MGGGVVCCWLYVGAKESGRMDGQAVGVGLGGERARERACVCLWLYLDAKESGRMHASSFFCIWIRILDSHPNTQKSSFF